MILAEKFTLKIENLGVKVHTKSNPSIEDGANAKHVMKFGDGAELKPILSCSLQGFVHVMNWHVKAVYHW